MRVTLCVDALAPNPGGIGRYTSQLCQGLAQHPDIDVRYYGRRQFIEDPGALLQSGQLPRRRFRRLGSWRDRRTLRNGLFHGTNYFLPPDVEGIITVHDLSVFKYPDTHPMERIRAFDRDFRNSLARARHIITDTETVRAELIADLGVDAGLVTAIHLGVDDRFSPQPVESVHILSRLGLQAKGYGLCVSTLEPRKKIAELVTAWRNLPLPLRSQYPLVLAGGAGWLNDSVRMEIERGVAEGWLRHLGFVDEDILPALYSGARLFVYPSIYEGFGLPPLEAMASGTPVIVSARSCMPEVCGDAARYIDPEDPDDIRAAIAQCLVDESWRGEAAKRGLLQASKYGWDRCVDETVAVYRKIAGSAVSIS